jgi:hypothetical protein
MGRDIFSGMRRIPVAMPTSDAYKKTVNRDALVQRYGESTVSRAELAAIMNIMIAVGVCSSSEIVDIVIRQCEMIEQRRRADANLDEDKG